MSGNELDGKIRDNLGEDTDIHDTLDPDEAFFTTKAKLELALSEYKEGIESRRAWVNPLIISLTILSAFIFTDFSKRFGLSADFWKAFYIFALAASLLWLAFELRKWWKNRSQAEVDAVMKNLKTQ